MSTPTAVPPPERITGVWTGDTWYAPPLSRWGRAWRLVVVVLVSVVSSAGLVPVYREVHPGLVVLDVAVGLACLWLVTTRRRRWPLAVALVSNALTAVSGAAGGPATLALVSLATRRRWREILPAAGVAAVAGGAQLVLVPDPDLAGLGVVGALVPSVFVVVLLAGLVAWGMYVGSRRELLATLRERAERAEADQGARVVAARQAERARIAREMHDVLAHRLSLVTVHAGALTYRDELPPEEYRRAAAVIEEGSRQALVELRQVLGLLRQDEGDAAPAPPQPSAADVHVLVAEVRAAGLRLDVEVGVDLDGVPDDVGRTAYRVVQEGLTNVRRHAPQVRAGLRVSGGPGEGLTVEVRNPLQVGRQPVPAGGLGLVGLAERASAAGGRLAAGTGEGDQFVLTVWLPWPP